MFFFFLFSGWRGFLFLCYQLRRVGLNLFIVHFFLNSEIFHFLFSALAYFFSLFCDVDFRFHFFVSSFQGSTISFSSSMSSVDGVFMVWLLNVLIHKKRTGSKLVSHEGRQ